MIDITTETLLSLMDAAKQLPGRPHVSTLYRWRIRGVRGVRLETVLVGGRRFTSKEALQRFADGTTAAADGAHVCASIPADEERAWCETNEELDREGL